MSIQDLGAIGEFIASIAVLITLIFLVFQVKQNTRIIVRSNARGTYQQEGEALRALLDKEVSEIFLRGNNEGLSSLTPEERYRFDIAYILWLHAIEQAFADFRDGLYPADQLVPFENAIQGFLSTPGGSSWWSERKYWCGPIFRGEVEKLLNNHGKEAAHAGPQPKSDSGT